MVEVTPGHKLRAQIFSLLQKKQTKKQQQTTVLNTEAMFWISSLTHWNSEAMRLNYAMPVTGLYAFEAALLYLHTNCPVVLKGMRPVFSVPLSCDCMLW